MSNMKLVKEIRQRSNISLGLCKKAADQSGGDVDKALQLLQEWGHLKAAKREVKEAKCGKVFSYIHTGSQVGVMVEINCETDFSANSDVFNEFGEQVCLQIASMQPLCIDVKSIPSTELANRGNIIDAQIASMGKKPPQQVLKQIASGKWQSYYSEVCLLNQESVMCKGKTIDDLRAMVSAQIGEKVVIKRFVRWEVGGQ